MNLFAVSFFGHRQVDDPFLIERQLESIIRELLLTKDMSNSLLDETENLISLFHQRSQMQANHP
jgi:hypothetical protein